MLLEAMASGKPIVASNIPGYASVITSEKEGLLVNPKDAGALAEALRNLTDNPNLRFKMGKEGLKTSHTYDWKNVASQIAAVYLETINAHTHRSAPNVTDNTIPLSF